MRGLRHAEDGCSLLLRTFEVKAAVKAVYEIRVFTFWLSYFLLVISATLALLAALVFLSQALKKMVEHVYQR